MTLGFVILAAEVALCLYVLIPVLLAYRRVRREWVDLKAEWDAHQARIDDLRSDFEPLLDRIARDQAAVLHAEVAAVLKAAAGS